MRIYRVRLLAAAAGAVTLLLMPPATAGDTAQGAPGIGDAYYPDYGNGGYDVSHYDLRLRYQPSSDHLEGTATILATATQNLSRFQLDFALDVAAVEVNGVAAKHATAGSHELVITPEATISKDQPMNVVVRYADTPSKVKVGTLTAWQRTSDGAVAANEPEMAWWWFPSNDHPLDKATYDVSVSVPDGTSAISNGVLTRTSSQLGWTRYNWRETKPQATYLATLAVGKFEILKGKTKGGVPVINAYSHELGSSAGAARASLERTSEVVDWESGVFGPYPFDAAGGYVPQTSTRFALETQTRVFYSPAFFTRGANLYVVVHENAHQWFGDSVSVASWRDIWLNEGFASYAEWLWSEKQGEGTAQQLANYAYAFYPADSAFWKVKPGDPGKGNEFHHAVYDRGAMTLQALRTTVGDGVFFRIIRDWVMVKRYGNASVAEFIDLAERISGKRLDELFRTWLYTSGRPAVGPAAPGARVAPRGRVDKPGSWERIHRLHQAVHARG
ncbi:MAG: Peptidase rane alanine aminopeptidase [Streptosporangiaceae bacterium]|nr:Peptidase rane alanine aminopeptidase [Streptosporangiaceae bacterium]